MTKRTPEQYMALRTEVRAMTTDAIVALRDGTDDEQVRNCCVVALSMRGVYDLPEQSPEDLAREEASLRRAYHSMN